MDFSNFNINNGKSKEKLNNVKHGVRKDQISKNFRNLFEVYDVNKDGTLENIEVEKIFKAKDPLKPLKFCCEYKFSMIERKFLFV